MNTTTDADLFLNTHGFLDDFLHRHRNLRERPFCWVLGSGASQSSGIPMGRKLTDKWLTEMYERAPHTSNPKPSIEEWANEKFKKSIPGFSYERAVDFYPYIYQCRYERYPEDGFIFLESIMQNAKPEFGYKILAQIMANTNHSVAVTTNFDTLLSDALTLYTDKRPFVCGHELLANFVIRNLRRPLIAKIHRDLFLAPKNNPDEIARLAHEWEAPLTEIFTRCMPIVIGFGDTSGSGGSLMRFLEKLPPIEGGIFWCYRVEKPTDMPTEAVRELVKRHNGQLVPILGFDELMLQLWEKLELTSVYEELNDRYNTLIRDYQKGFHRVAEGIVKLDCENANETVATAIKYAKAALERLNRDSV
jgi:hypothetical protein